MATISLGGSNQYYNFVTIISRHKVVINHTITLGGRNYQKQIFSI
jgi:hypothetical protein